MLNQPNTIYPTDFLVLERVMARVWDPRTDAEFREDVAAALIRLWRSGVTDEETLVKAMGAWRSPKVT
jgi:hypothetical protein